MAVINRNVSFRTFEETDVQNLGLSVFAKNIQFSLDITADSK